MSYFPDTITVQKTGLYGTSQDIQKAIDQALESPHHCTVYIPMGLWKLHEPLRLHPKGDPVGINFSVQVRGARPAFGGQGGHQAFTVLECEFGDAPAFDIQATRATTIADLAIEGQNRSAQQWLCSITDYVHLHRDDVWIDDGITEDHVAIAIDRAAGSGSSLVLIDNVNARYFAAGITIGTSGDPQTLNSENHLIRRFHGQYLGKAGIVLGQHQTKGISIVDSFFYGQQYWIDCVRHGLRLGFPPTLTGCTIGGTQRLFNLVHSIGQLSCQGLFVESFLSIGTLGWGSSSQNLPAVFTGCQFDFFQQPKTEDLDVHLLCERPVLFQGCNFQFNREDTRKVFLRIHNTQQIVFDVCTFAWRSFNDLPPIAFHVEGFARFRDCSYQSSWWKYLDGKVAYEKQTLGTIPLEKKQDGTVCFQLPNAATTLQVGDFIGFDKTNTTYWTPKIHVPDRSQPHKTFLPFGIVGAISVNTVQVHQVATAIYKQLDNSPTWNLFRWRTVI